MFLVTTYRQLPLLPNPEFKRDYSKRTNLGGKGRDNIGIINSFLNFFWDEFLAMGMI